MVLQRNLVKFLFFITAAGSLSAAPILRLSSGAVTVQTSGGTNAANQTVYASNAGDGTLNLTATSSATWLTAQVGSNATCPVGTGNCIPIQLALSAASLAPGTYTGFITVSDPNAVDSPQTISVTVQVGGVPASLDLYATPNGGKATATIETHGATKAVATTQTGGSWLSVTGAGSFGFFTPYLVTATSQA